MCRKLRGIRFSWIFCQYTSFDWNLGVLFPECHCFLNAQCGNFFFYYAISRPHVWLFCCYFICFVWFFSLNLFYDSYCQIQEWNMFAFILDFYTRMRRATSGPWVVRSDSPFHLSSKCMPKCRIHFLTLVCLLMYVLLNVSAFAELLDNSLDEVYWTEIAHCSSLPCQFLLCLLSGVSLQGWKWSYLCEHRHVGK